MRVLRRGWRQWWIASSVAHNCIRSAITAASRTSNDIILSMSPGTLWLGNELGRQAASSPNVVGRSCRVCFRNLTDETLILCWINETGQPHHFYALHPNSKGIGFLRGRPLVKGDSKGDDGDHIETTVEGHAFLVAAPGKWDVDVDTIRKERSLDNALVVGAYRPEPATKQAAQEKETDAVLHLVEVVDPSRSPIHRLQNLFSCCIPKATTTDATIGLNKVLNDDEDEVEQENKASRYILRVRLVTIDDAPMDTTCKHYERTILGHCEWPVMVEPNWYGNDADLERTLARDLDHMASCLPPHAVKLLRDEKPTPIWINATFRCGPKRCPKNLRHMCFHPGKSWLEQNGMHAEKCECVELYCAANYRETRTNWGVGGLLLHEFSHAYHHKACPDGYDNAEIQECYEQAMKEGLYDSVRVHGTQGPTAKAYACTNAMEYFAELSTAFLGGTPSKQRERGSNSESTKELEEFNKWYPFHREQIREHDPRAYSLLRKIWKVDEE